MKYYITLFVIVVMVALILSSGSKTNTPDTPYMPSDSDAYVTSQTFVKLNLKAPATADFPTKSQAKIFQSFDDDNIWEVTSYVDAQNSFGALIRSNFYVKIEYVPAKEEWKLLDIKID